MAVPCRPSNAEPGFVPGLVYALVTWMDACFEAGAKVGLGDVDCTPGMLLHTAGIIIRETDEVLVLCCDFAPDDMLVRHITRIPRCLVRSIERHEIRS